MTLRKSPNRNSFQKESYLKNRAEEGKTPDNNKEVKQMLEMYESWDKIQEERELDPKWQENNLEYDLRTSDMISEKCQDRVYAQHLYAALCNNAFIKNEVWPILQDKQWSCSWRYAGGIIANIRQQGDYIDWYCSGMIHDSLSDEEFSELSFEEQIRIKENNSFVSESTVTDEIKKDLFQLGWLVVEDNHE